MKIRNSTFSLFLILIIASCSTSEKDCSDNNEIIAETIERLSDDFQDISDDIQNAATFTSSLYSNENKSSEIDTSIYILSKEQTIYKKDDDGGSAIFVSGFVPVSPEIYNIIGLCEPLDSLFKEIKEKHDIIVQLFYYDENSILRLFPFFDVQSQFKSQIDISKFRFYELANKKNNPERNVVIVNKPYIDPAGRGLVVSVISPVYVQNQFVGVIGANVTINTILDNYFAENSLNVLIVNDSGNIITANSYVYNVLSLPIPDEYQYFKYLSKDTYTDNINLLSIHKNLEFRNYVKRLIEHENKRIEMELNEYKFCLIPFEMKRFKWHLIKFIKI